MGGSVAEELLKIHRSYLKPIRALDDAGILKGAAHITGGGITENTPRILPKGLGVHIQADSWPVLPVFELLRKIGRIPEDDWRRTFNLGIGMILVVSPWQVGRGFQAAQETARALLSNRRGGEGQGRGL